MKNPKSGRRQFPGWRSQPQQQLPPEPPRQLKIDTGHNGTQVVMQFAFAITNLLLTEEQTERIITDLQGALEKLRTHKAATEVRVEVES